VLQQEGELRVSVKSLLANGVKLGAGARWVQLGRTLISAGQPGHDLDFSLSTLAPHPHIPQGGGR
jgi:hypothetical protein